MLNLRELTIKNKQNIPDLDWELLATNAINQTREYFFSHPEYVLNIFERVKLWRSIARYKKGWPVAYILGHKEFFGLDFLVNKHTLIPRPETELMVENVVEEISKLRNGAIAEKILLVDVGAGTGCIPIAIANIIARSKRRLPAFGEKQSQASRDCRVGLRPPRNDSAEIAALANGCGAPRGDIQILATDTSNSALRVAKKNAARHGIKIIFLQGSLLGPIIERFALHVTRYTHIVVTANLPYLTAEQFDNEPSIQHEPKTALVAENQGLALHEKLLRQINSIISNFAISQLPNISIYLEIDPSQSARILESIKNNLPDAKTQIKKDLA
ncbi:HemK family protein methyltransferase, partial [Patescibacteria group bacterium]|nr:HemK family protein methyltransferase [Patescibacteria group bacterium]